MKPAERLIANSDKAFGNFERSQASLNHREIASKECVLLGGCDSADNRQFHQRQPTLHRKCGSGTTHYCGWLLLSSAAIGPIRLG